MTKRQICYATLVSLLIMVCLAEKSSAVEPLLNLNLKNADIKDVLRGIAMQYGVNIVPDGDVTGNVTIHLQDAPFETGQRIIRFAVRNETIGLGRQPV